jgi:GMP synthase (glutamine-hydrolysing)
MKTLIINSYPEESAEKLRLYTEAVSAFTQQRVVPEASIRPGTDLAGISACLLTGSPKMITQGEYSPELVRFLATTTLPILGICYGHQLLAMAWGSEIGRGERIKRVFPDDALAVTVRVRDPLFSDLADTLEVDEDHREYVLPPPQGGGSFTVLADSPLCKVEAIVHKTKLQYGTQFHLERSGETGRKILENFYRLAAEQSRLSS